MKPSDINYEFFFFKCSSKQIKKKLYIRILCETIQNTEQKQIPGP